MSTSTSPITVLVHGAFADASRFTGVIRELGGAGHTVVAPPNPLRSLAFDAAALADFVAAIDGPVLLVGHSYGGAVITQASATLGNVTGLVYLAAFGLDAAESCASVLAPVEQRLPHHLRRAWRTARARTVYQPREVPRDLLCGRSCRHG
jgi:pimeloyl-ACP methyl ester carboxylesterase